MPPCLSATAWEGDPLSVGGVSVTAALQRQQASELSSTPKRPISSDQVAQAAAKSVSDP